MTAPMQWPSPADFVPEAPPVEHEQARFWAGTVPLGGNIAADMARRAGERD